MRKERAKIRNFTSTTYLTASEAARELGISVATLYAYVSRGLIRSEAGTAQGRVRRYYVEDVVHLKARREARRDPGGVARKSLVWGMPVLESAITMISEGRLYYRGYDAIQLALTSTLEDVAGLIWLDALSQNVTTELFSFPRELEGFIATLPKLRSLSLIETLQVILPLAGAADAAAFDLRREAVARTGGRILRLLSLSVTKRSDTVMQPIARILHEEWAPRDTAAIGIFNASLIACADHELNVSSYTARCVASAAATPYDVVLAGLAALKGSKHGGATARVDAFLREVQTPRRVRRAIAERLRRGEPIPGFGHPLYAQGDPRARMLLDLLVQTRPHVRATELASCVAAEMQGVTGEGPNVDFALTAIAWALNLPDGAPLALFGLGRTVGWIGHAIEQYALDQLIRPRARYVGRGLLPASSTGLK